MSPRAWIALAALAGAVGAAALGARTGDARRASPASSSAPASPTARAAARAIEWPAGTRHVYRLAWKSEHAVRVASGEAMAVAVDLAGELAIDAYGRRGDVWILAASFASLSRAHLAINGKPVYADDAATARELVGKRATVEVDARGTVRRVATDADPSGVFRHLMRGVLVELSVTLPGAGDSESRGTEIGPNGSVRAHYAVDPSDPSRVRRRREEYESLSALGARVASDEASPAQELDARATITLGADGALASIASSERLVVVRDGSPAVVAQTSFDLALAAVARFDASEPAALADARPLDAPAASSDLSRRLLEQRVDGLDVARMKTDLAVFAATGSIVDQERWVWRATGLLEQRPEACDDLAASFESPGLDSGARGLVLDLLASVGHERAQAAMRRALASRAAASDEALPLFVQRFAFVASPSRESVEALLASRAAAQARGHAALADAIDYTLGSVAGHLAASGEGARATALHATLRARLDAASSGHARKVALAALGNAGFEEDAPAILAASADGDEDVRSQVAWSLRKLESPATRLALVALLGDPRAAVQTSAARTLASMTLADADLAALEGVAARVRPTTYLAALALLPAGDAHGRRVVEALLARGDADPEAEAKLRAWLAP